MRNDQHPGDERPGGMRETVAIAQGVFVCTAKLAEAWLRKPGTAGQHYFAGPAFVGLLLAGLLMTMVGGRNLEVAYGFLGMSALLMAMHRAGAVRLDNNGRICHRLYCGDSRLARDPDDDLRAKRVSEPVFCLILAAGAAPFCPALAAYLAAAAVSLIANYQQWKAELASRLADARDARIEEMEIARNMRRW